jgi:hypothetical protein
MLLSGRKSIKKMAEPDARSYREHEDQIIVAMKETSQITRAMRSRFSKR